MSDAPAAVLAEPLDVGEVLELVVGDHEDRALGGASPAATFQDAFDSADFTKLGGCRRKAIEAVFGGAQVLGEIQGKLDQLDERIVQDQRMVKATERWSSCMGRRRLSHSDPDAIDVDLEKRLEKIVGLAGEVPDRPAAGRAAAAVRPRSARGAATRGARDLESRHRLDTSPRSSPPCAPSTRRSSASAIRGCSVRSSPCRGQQEREHRRWPRRG